MTNQTADTEETTDAGPMTLDGIVAPPLPELVVPEGHVKVRRLNSHCYIPGDGVVVQVGEVWHIPADEADEVCYPTHPYGMWELVTENDDNAPMAQVSDDPGTVPEEEHPANVEEIEAPPEAAETAEEAPPRRVPRLEVSSPRRYVMPDGSSVRSTTDPSADAPAEA